MSKVIRLALLGGITLLVGLIGCGLALMTNKPQVFLSCAICAAISMLPIQGAQFAYQEWREGGAPPFDWNWNLPIIGGSVLIAGFVAFVIWLAHA